MKNAIYDILKNEWKVGNGYDPIWLGYSALTDCLSERGIKATLKEAKAEMKNLKNEGKVKQNNCFDEDGKLKGRGWFAN